MRYQLAIAFAFPPPPRSRPHFSGAAASQGGEDVGTHGILVTAQVGQALDDSRKKVMMQPLASVGWVMVTNDGVSEVQHSPPRAAQSRDFFLAPNWVHDLEAQDALVHTAKPLEAIAVRHKVPAETLAWHYILREMDGPPPPPSFAEVHAHAVACVCEHLSQNRDIFPQKQSARFS